MGQCLDVREEPQGMGSEGEQVGRCFTSESVVIEYIVDLHVLRYQHVYHFLGGMLHLRLRVGHVGMTENLELQLERIYMFTIYRALYS